MFYNLCVTNSRDFILRMANIIDYLSDGLYEEDMDTEPPRGIVDIPSSESEVENFGDDDERDSSFSRVIQRFQPRANCSIRWS